MFLVLLQLMGLLVRGIHQLMIQICRPRHLECEGLFHLMNGLSMSEPSCF